MGHGAKVLFTKDLTTIVGDGSTQDAVNQHVAQIKNLIEVAEQEYEKKKRNDRIAKFSGGVVVIQVRAQTERAKRKEVESRGCSQCNKGNQAAVEESIVVVGGCTLLRLASKVDAIKDSLENGEEKGYKLERVLSYPSKLIAKNAGANGSVVNERYLTKLVLPNDNPEFGYNVAMGEYEDLMVARIIDPTKTSLGILFLDYSLDDLDSTLFDDIVVMLLGTRNFGGENNLGVNCVVVEIIEHELVPTGNPMGNSGNKVF
ncbi:chaperonin 60 subunit beta 2, chloroplastic-like [Rhododendron vialii]|uniref:chaperonin 60 subunit beta 2, chloroplastic-like n=1 Tax=Rhododendron vialii TaxID=182163 RepID=UPI00265E701E|nr:chaperonin 60 subunit beta 2, chloroplastic-like [Rhododendron vialii]